MRILRDLGDLTDASRRGAVAIGNFDGVHQGHIAIISQLKALARSCRGPAVIFTFDPHPVRILRPQACPPPLTWTERKGQLLAAQGIDSVVAYPTDEALLGLTAREFFDQIVVDALQAQAIVEGPNFNFGKNREGDISMLRSFAEEANIHLEIVEPVACGESLVSSSRIRELIQAGEVEQAHRLLTQPYRVRGIVAHGAGRGRKIGFPTANLDGVDTLLPEPGVYAGFAWFDGNQYAAAIHLGPSPTFDQREVKVEVHLIDQNLPLYGQPLEVDFLKQLREIRPFTSSDALVRQLEQDVQESREIVARALAGRDTNA